MIHASALILFSLINCYAILSNDCGFLTYSSRHAYYDHGAHDDDDDDGHGHDAHARVDRVDPAHLHRVVHNKPSVAALAFASAHAPFSSCVCSRACLLL